MKFVVIAVILALVSFVSSQNVTCSQVSYGREGEVCMEGSSKLQCNQFTKCVSGVCRDSYVGAVCTRDSDCSFNSPLEEGIRCLKGVCTKKRYAGFVCQSDDECYTTTCKGGVCVGFKQDEPCNPLGPVSCDKGLYCSLKSQKCIPQITEGQNCEDYDNQPEEKITEGSNFMIICPGGTKCSRLGHGLPYPICKTIYTQKFGQACNVTEECYLPLTCQNGLCGRNLELNEKCGASNCTASNMEKCICLDGAAPTCKSVANNCNFEKAMQDWSDCWGKFNCRYQKDPTTAMLVEAFSKESCMGQMCGSIAKEYLCCAYNGYQTTRWSIANSVPLGCSAGTAVIVVVVLLLCVFVFGTLGGLAGLGFYFYQKSKAQYHVFQYPSGTPDVPDSQFQKMGEEQ